MRRADIPAHTSWRKMLERVRGKGHSSYVGREVDERWLDFSAFHEDMGDRPDGHWLERIDNSKGYGPDNCKWASPVEQCRNRTITRNLTLEGKTQSIGAWAEELGLNYNTLNTRIQRGWTDERALTQPLKGL